MSQPLPTREEIVRCLSHHSRALNAREIAKHTGVQDQERKRLLDLLHQLSIDGTLLRLPGNRFKLARDESSDQEEWEGMLSVSSRGFGFVTAVGQEDVYIAPASIGGALHGDRVRIAIVNRSRRGVEGRILDVVRRRSPRVAGVLRKRRKSAWLEPDDDRVRGPIVIADGYQDHRDGEAAVVNITRFPATHDENPEGELVAVLGEPGDVNAEVAKILIREQISEEHPAAAMQEAEAMAARLARLSGEGRRDLRDVPLLTIDPTDARDHDDAVWAQRKDDGYRVYISIADVSEYVAPDSALDNEALSRGCTIYLPDRAIPMLPAALAADLCSLLPETERLCLCVIADLEKNGKVKRFEIVEGLQRGAAMISYGGAARALGFTEAPPRSPQAEAFKRDLRVLDEVARKLRRARLKRGALDLDLPEPKLTLDPQTGHPLSVKRRTEDPGIKRAYQVVEELMLLANELVAQWLTKKKCPTIFRVHAKPDEERLERLGEVAQLLSAPFDLESLLDPKGVSRWLQQIADHPKRSVLENTLLRSLKQAVYDIANIGHFGLASEAYVHFTSPIRRYPDLQVHRAIKHILRGGKPDESASHIEALRSSATQASTRERASMDVEREVVDLYRALIMREHVGKTFEGTVNAFVGTGMYVSLDDPFVDVLVRFEGMGPDRYELSDDQLNVFGIRSGDTIQLGDRVLVTVEDVALLRRTIYGRRVPPEAALKAHGRRKRGKKRGRSDSDSEPRTRRGAKTRSRASSETGSQQRQRGGRRSKSKRSKRSRQR